MTAFADQPRFIYYFKAAGEAVAHTSRSDHAGDLLFTCPQSWLPCTQLEFERAARYYGIACPERIKYSPEEVPF